MGIDSEMFKYGRDEFKARHLEKIPSINNT